MNTILNASTVELPSFLVIGIAVRTTNQGGQMEKDIRELWDRFVKEDILSKIPDKESSDIYNVYVDYDNEASGHYTTIIGARVSSLEKVPESFIGKTIPASRYQVFVSKGKLPGSVQKTWEDIWNSGIQRKWVADFDKYGPASRHPKKPEVETYLSIP
jgi:predicted transcriptional regulator YdeE